MTREQVELIVLSFLDDMPTVVQREAVRKLDAHDAEQRQTIEVLTKERDKYKMEALVKFDCQVCSGALEKENEDLRQTIATLTERVRELENVQTDYNMLVVIANRITKENVMLKAELNEQWVDEKGTVWTRPTAWAYAQACRVMHENKERVRELEAQHLQ